MLLRMLSLLTLLMIVGCMDLQSLSQAPNEVIERLDELRVTDPARAVVELKKQLEIHPKDDMIWTLLGHAYEELDQYTEAKDAYDNALKINPQRAQAWTGLGIISRAEGDYAKAMEQYEKAVAADPTWSDAYSSMAVVALKQGAFEKALTYAKKGYELDSTSATVAANLAVSYHYNNMPEQRDQLTEVAERLGYPNIEALKLIYAGEYSIQD